jgi:excisionase family DNA binding protein
VIAPQPVYYRPVEISHRLGINVSKVLSWIRCGDLRAVNVVGKLGGRPRWRISVADLDAFLETRAAKPPPPRLKKRRSSKDLRVVEYF